MINEEMACAVRYRAAFETTWLAYPTRWESERTRRRWLERHLVDLGRMENAKSEEKRM